MENLKALKYQLTILKALPDYYDLAEALLNRVSHIEKEVALLEQTVSEKASTIATAMFVEIVNGKTQYAVFNKKGYKISAVPLETIPDGAQTLFISTEK